MHLADADRVAGGRAEKVVTLRMRSRITGGPVIVRVGAVESDNPSPLALVMSTELVWPEGFAQTVQEAFGLTAAEVEIVQETNYPWDGTVKARAACVVETSSVCRCQRSRSE